MLLLFQGPIELRVQVPSDSNNSGWKLNGQMLTLSCSVSSTVKEVKQMLSVELGGMPPNKQQLKDMLLGFLKDSSSLAKYNISNGHTPLELVVRSRGRRR